MLLAVGGLAPAAAQQTVPEAGRPEPLAVHITLHARDVALREALDRVAALARVRISYSGDVVPLDRRVSVAREGASVGEVLLELLAGLPVAASVVGSDHIVLVPRQRADTGRVATPVLERVVVTGSVLGAPERSLAVALDVVQGRDAELRDESSVSSMLNGAVPGVWLWEQAPSGMAARYGSIRGASSFSVSYPKVYVDGIEVANPLLLSQVDAEQVERVEVIRGPQGAALFGADAISGVVNIISRHENAAAGRRATVESRMGWIASAYADATPLQEHSLALRGGDNLRSAGVSGRFTTTGRYIPNAQSREGRLAADARFVGATSTLSLVGRFHGKRTGVPINPLLPDLEDDRTAADAEPQSLDLYSLGGTWRRAASESLTFALTAGFDGYQLGNISIESTPVPSSADSALRAATGGADRFTLRANVMKLFGDDERVGGTLHFVVEQGALRDRTDPEVMAPTQSGPSPLPDASRWSSNFGIASQGRLSLRRALHLSAGTRLERISRNGALPDWEALPMLGASLVRDLGGVTAKLRTSYGRGIRAVAPVLPVRDRRRPLSNPWIAPEEQTGIDGGADLYFGGALSAHLTRFDQTARNLVQLVTLYDTTSSGTGSSRERIHYQRQNVGEITNRGWEGRVALRAGMLDLSASGTQVDSRVRAVAPSYSGDVRPGDRVLGVPERTGSVSAGVTRRRWSTAWTVTRASNWIDYDRLAIAERLDDDLENDDAIAGEKLRQFWVRYPGATRLRGTVGVELPRGVSLRLTGENLTGEQRGEPDSMTILPGRTVIAGLTARF
ncbi:MAG TPA: TonB-dependent receptor [Gemmatimonadaceae bacterium]|nr:TonB-dependent receptor [Gemmatimonadaceae bacterium]